MSFDADWLSLREPADRAARHQGLMETCARHLAPVADPLIIDIGCGTGSTLRSLSNVMPGDARWLLVDNDPRLLDRAAELSGDKARADYQQLDLNALDRLPLESAAMVTASALFDLCSEAFTSAFSDVLSRHRIGLYAALNYNGRIGWSVSHPLDESVVESFNRHQQTDKGFGVALGPAAAERLEALLESRGFKVETGDSPWRLSGESAALQKAFVEGFRQPLQEIGGLSSGEIEDWIAFRIAATALQDSHCTVGHTDIIALPA
ncbi:class I SAM-dependent methyltransferase [Martelella limonii]|uniref:class I SAM-dependent methyltransferase n=1 Tax=Martelella limonii TaxID=1647649 RepID=UPI001FCF138E|nr:class I SAM-dependent methyltransferase [Martelella limonii]